MESQVSRKAAGLAFVQAGEGPDVVLIHGLLSGLQDMAVALFGSLEGEFRVTAFDRPGHGGSLEIGGGAPRRQAELIHASIEALGLRRPVIVGHSLGGAVALAYAILYPGETAGIVALAPIAFPEPRLEHALFASRTVPGPIGFWSNSIGRTMDPLLLPTLWRAMFLPQAMPAKFAEHFPFAVAGRAAQVLVEGQDAAAMTTGLMWNGENYPACAARVHILAGDADIVVNPSLHSGLLARALPHAHFTRLPGLGHMIQHFAQAEIAEAVRDLQRLA